MAARADKVLSILCRFSKHNLPTAAPAQVSIDDYFQEQNGEKDGGGWEVERWRRERERERERNKSERQVRGVLDTKI